MRKIGISLLCAGSLFSTTALSVTNHTFSQGPTVEYELPPNDPQIFSNVFFWEIKASCTIISEVSDNSIFVTMLRKTGAINDQPLSAGDTLGLMFQPGDKLHITATPGAKVELINQGTKTIKAICATG